MGTKQNVMTPETLLREADQRSSQEIESDIREKRNRMDSTLDQLGERLNVRSLMNSALEWWDSPSSGNQGNAAARRALKTVATQMKHHPMPSLLIGGGLAWLIADAGGDDATPAERPGEPSRVSDRLPKSQNGGVGSSLSHAKDAAAGAMESAKEKLSDLGSRTHRSADHLAHEAYVVSRSAARKIKQEVKEDYHAAGERFGRAVEEYPLAVGVVFAALGALAGLALPRSRKEDEMMGSKSDHVVEAAKEKGAELLESGKAVGERVIETVAEEAKEQGFTADKVTGALSAMAEKGGAILQKAKDEAAQAATDEGLKPPGRNGGSNPSETALPR